MAKETRIGLGMAALGRPDYINLRTHKNIDKSIKAFRSNAFQVIDKAYALGIRDFDVAPSYGLGEEFLLDWHKTKQFKDVAFSTKFGYTYMADWEIGFNGKHEVKEHSLSKLNEQWDISRAFLPHLNIYQIHSATLESGVLTNNAVLGRLYQLKKEYGLKIGLSSSGTAQESIIKTAQEITFEGEDLFDSFQVTYNIFEQSTYNILKALIHNHKTVIIKEALANGRLLHQSSLKTYIPAYDYLQQLEKKYNVGYDAIAIRFIIDHLKPTIVLSGASNIEQLEQNYKALNFKLTDLEVKQLETFMVSKEFYWQERSNLEWN
ncbi:MAG: aldo/keto reductase [Winogradskyella sp.]